MLALQQSGEAGEIGPARSRLTHAGYVHIELGGTAKWHTFLCPGLLAL